MGTAQGQILVVGRRADAIGVADDRDRVVAHAAQFSSEGIQSLAALRFQRRLIEIEQRVGLEADLGRSRRRLRGHRSGRGRSGDHRCRGWRGVHHRRYCWVRAEAIEQAQGSEIDVARVADGVVDPVTLALQSSTQRLGEIVLQAEPVLDVGIAFATLRFQHVGGAGADEAHIGLGVVGADARETREAFGEGQEADRVQVEPLDLDATLDRSRRIGDRVEIKFAEVKVTSLQREVAAEAITAEELVAEVTLVSAERSRGEAAVEQTLDDALVVNRRAGLAKIAAEIEASVVRRARGAEAADQRKAENRQAGNDVHDSLQGFLRRRLRAPAR